MSGRVVRSAQIAGLIAAAILVVLLVDLAVGNDGTPAPLVPWDVLLGDTGGTVGAAVRDPAHGVPYLWPVQSQGRLIGVVAIGTATGYQSRVEVAVFVPRTGAPRGTTVIRHGESSAVGRMLRVGGPDALSGATRTRRAADTAAATAIRSARTVLEEAP